MTGRSVRCWSWRHTTSQPMMLRWVQVASEPNCSTRVTILHLHLQHGCVLLRAPADCAACQALSAVCVGLVGQLQALASTRRNRVAVAMRATCLGNQLPLTVCDVHMLYCVCGHLLLLQSIHPPTFQVYDILNSLEDRLGVTNSAVVLAAMKVGGSSRHSSNRAVFV